MIRRQIPTTKTSGEATTLNIDNIPEDVASVVAKWIQSWGRVSGVLERREAARSQRDSALISLSLAFKKSKELFLHFLWENLTLSSNELLSLYNLIKQGSISGEVVKSVTFVPLGKRGESMESREELDERRVFISKLLSELPNLQSLSIELSGYPFQILQVHGSSSTPFKFLAKSLKRLKMAPPQGFSAIDHNLSARNVVWLLTFCTSLEAAALGFSCSIEDFDYIYDYRQDFEGLFFNVRELSLFPVFSWNQKDERPWKRSSSDKEKAWRSGSKTFAMHHLLAGTNQLYSLELIWASGLEAESNDMNSPNSTCINSTSLSTSLSSLRHLRIFGVSVDLHSIRTPTNTDFSIFDRLESFSFDDAALHPLVTYGSPKLPSSLSILALSFYAASDPDHHQFMDDESYCEERNLALLLIRTKSMLPNLKEVVVPELPIGLPGNVLDYEDRYKWLGSRRELERLGLFKTGRSS